MIEKQHRRALAAASVLVLMVRALAVRVNCGFRGAAVFALAGLIAMTPVGASSAWQRQDVSRIAASFRRELQATATPGGVVAVVSDGRVVFLKAAGLASIETAVPVTATTVFYSGGLSRFYTAATLLALVEQGRIDLGAPIGQYVQGLDPKIARLTSHQLLTSTSGLREDHLQRGLIDDDALAKLVTSWTGERVFTEPGRIYSGSHLNLTLVGRVIETVAGQPFADAIHREVFAPLGMTRSTYRPLIGFTYPIAQGHERAGEGKVRVHRPFAANTVGLPRASFGSIDDAARFLVAFVNDGKVDGRQVLAASVIERLRTPFVANPGSDVEQEGYGARFSRHAGYQLLSINTTWGGFATAVRIVPELRFAVYATGNGEVLLGATVEETMRQFLPPATPAVRPAEVPIDPQEMARVVGLYENERVLRLSVSSGRLVVKDESTLRDLGSVTDGEEWPVTKVGRADWRARAPGGQGSLQFRTIEDDTGQVVYLFYGGRVLIRQR